MNLKELVDQVNQIAGEKIAAKEFNNLELKPKDVYGYISASFDIDGVKYKGSFKENSHMWHITYGVSANQYDPVLSDEQANELYAYFNEELHKQELDFWTAEKAKAEEHLRQLAEQ